MRARSIAWRLALAFAAVCALVLSAIGVFLYRSLASELAWRDDMALLGRLEQVRALLADSDSLDALQARPRLYQNMLGNLDSLLLVQSVLQTVTVPEAVGHEIVTKAAGNPFFLEELTWSVRMSGSTHLYCTLPTTIQAVLAARLDRLPQA